MKNVFRKAVLFMLAMLIMGGICQVSAANWTGSGTESSPYLITNETSLRQLATDVNNGNSYSGKYFQVTADIALTQTWTPVGTSSTAFRGNFDGNGKTISGMTVSGSHSGLFAYVGSGATIKNVTLTDFSVEGDSYVAGLVAHADAGTGSVTISNCSVKGTLRDDTDSYPDGYLAGIVAYANAEQGSITISGCTSEGSYICDYYSGGIVGYGKGNDRSLKLLNCINYAGIGAGNNGDCCGGIAGYLSSAELVGCFNYGGVSGNAYSEDNGSSWLGGITGSGSGMVFTGCGNYGSISTFFAGGITPAQYGNSIVTSCLNVGSLKHSSDGYGSALIYSGSAVNSYYLSGTGSGITGAKSVTATELASGVVAYSLRDYFGQKIGEDAYPVPLTASNRVYKVTVVGEINRTYYVNSGDTIAFPELSACAAYYDGGNKFDTTTPITRDYALAAKGYHTFENGTCKYCGNDAAYYVDVGSCGDSVVWKITEDGVLTISGSGAMTDYSDTTSAPWYRYCSSIQSVQIGEDVTSIGAYAFRGLTNVTAVSISDTVTTIGDYAFNGLTSLTAVAIGDAVTSIGEYAFASCRALTDLTLNGLLTTIGNYAFYQCEGLTYVYVPAGVTTLGNGAFQNCTAMTGIGLVDGLTSIGSYALSGTGVTTMRIPATVTEIGGYAFANCADLTQVSFLGAAPAIADAAFSGETVLCLTPAYDSSWDPVINKNYGGTLTWAIGSGTCGTSLNWVLDYSGTLTISGTGNMTNYYAYRGESTAPWYSLREYIQTVEICDGVTSIGDYAFMGCSNLRSVTMADSVTKIGTVSTYSGYGCCFMDCTSLTEITIPAKVTAIAYSSFYGCSNLTKINVASGNTAYSSVDGVLYNYNKTALHCYPAGKTGDFTIPSTVSTINPYAFVTCKALSAVTVPSSVTSIGNYAFGYCSGLGQITFAGNAPTIGTYGFASVTATVDYPTADTTWTASMLKNYGGDLTWNAGSGTCGTGVRWDLTYENGAATLMISGTGAMNDYTSTTLPWADHVANIKTFVVSEGVTSVGAYALYGGTALKTVTLADSVTSIGEHAFNTCSALTTLTLGNGIQTIGDSAFRSTALTSITFPDSLKSLGRYAFSGCMSLRSLTFGSGMQSIGYTCFGGCTALQTVDLGTGVTTLEQSAFNGCSSLTKIVIPASVTSIGTYAFRDCTKLMYVEFLGNAPTFNSNAFSGSTCNAYYLSNKTGWTSNVLANYGGTITWGALSQRGTCGTSAEWLLDTDGKLYICGSSSMKVYSETSSAPWSAYQTSIKKVTLRGVTSIGAYAFSGCTAISEVVVPSTVTSIGTNAFAECQALQVVIFDGNAPSFGTNAFSGVTCEMWYPSTASRWTTSVCKDYGGTLTWRNTTSRGTCGTNARWALDSAGTLVVLGSGAMTSYSNGYQPWYSVKDTVKSVIIGGDVTSVSSYAFQNHTAIETVTIGDSVTNIYNYAFGGCTALNTITFRGNAPTSASYAFNSVTATAYYPRGNTTWTAGKQTNYGGTLTWEALCMPHIEAVLSAVEPTCITSGLTEGSRCSSCGEVLIAQEDIPALGHYAMGPDGTAVPADTLEPECTENIVCTVCGDVAKEAMGHRVLGTVPVEADPLTISNTSTYPFTLTNGTYYSTNKASDSSSSLVITAQYDCSLTLNYGVSSEEDYDKLIISLNNTTKATISGEVDDKTLTLALSAGDVVRVRYKKDEDTNNGKDKGWVKLVYDPVMVDGVGDVPADTAEPDCTNGVVCRYCQTVIKEALGHRVVVPLPEPEAPFTVENASSDPFTLTDGVYYSSNHSHSSTSTLQFNVISDCSLTLNYGVSSETCDRLTIGLNGTTKATISGSVSDQTLTLDVSAGDVITVSYSKDSSVNHEEDQGWVSVHYDSGPAEEIVQADTLEPDCANGVICDYCDTVVKNALDHVWNEGTVTTEPTCTEEGVKTFVCQNDQNHYYTEPVAAIGHSFTDYKSNDDATCTEDGTRTAICDHEGCDETETITNTGTVTDHVYGEPVFQWSADYSACKAVRTCEKDDSHQDTADAEVSSVTVDPGCEAGGSATYTAVAIFGENEYRDVKKVVLDPTDHAYGEPVFRWNEDHTECTATRTCKNDTGHTEEATAVVTIDTVDATCEVDGYESYTAKVTFDGKEYQDVKTKVLNATSHNYDNGVVTTEPTCTEDGVKTFTCQNDQNHYYTESVAATDHSFTDYKSNDDATCTEDGTRTAICDNNGCDKTDTVEDADTATGHSYTTNPSDKLDNAATCAKAATYFVQCDRCDAVSTTKTVTVGSKLGHIDKNTNHVCDRGCGKTNMGTCADSAKDKDHVCDYGCKKVLEDCTGGEAVIEKSVEATCTEAGGYDSVVYCTVCGKEVSREGTIIPATGHTEETIPEVEATCTKTGLTEGTKCSTCGEPLDAQQETKALGHSYTTKASGSLASAATCEKAATYFVQCDRCDAVSATKTVTVGSKLGHIDKNTNHVCDRGCGKTNMGTCADSAKDKDHVCDYGCKKVLEDCAGGEAVIEKSVEATCTEAGGYDSVVYCTICGKEVSREETIIPATGHTEETIPEVEATCTKTGLTEGTKCSSCGELLDAQKETKALGHSFTDYRSNNDATCTEDGTKTAICDRNDCQESDTISDVGSATGHTWDDGVVTTPETADKDGVKTFTCTCGETRTETIPAIGHTFDDGVVTKNATCTEPGIKTFTCQNCAGHSYTGEIPATGHSYMETKVTAPTCTEQGYTTYTCSSCDHSYQDNYVGVTGHSYDSGKVTTAATCTKTGVKTYTCKNCGATKTASIKATGHTEVTDKAVAATCAKTGLTEGKHCSVCNTVIVKQKTVAKLAHTWDEGKVTKNPTAEKVGQKLYTCTGCKTTKTEEIPALGGCDGGATCVTKRFTDVKSDWTHEGIDFAVANGLFNGTSATTFAPDTTMTRAMLVTVLWRNEGSPAAGSAPFTDLTQDWYKTAVAWAAENDIVNGVGEGEFDPDGDVTREQIAVILFRYANYKGIDTTNRASLSTFPDKAKVSTWAEDALKWAVAESLISGVSTNGVVTLNPGNGGTRAMVATIMMRYIQNVVEG